MEKLTIDFSSQSTIDEADATSSRFGLRKSTRARSNSSNENLHKLNRRTIARPKKVITVDSSDKDIKNFYLNINKKNVNVKSSALETIQEEENENNLDETTEDEGNLSLNSFLTKKSRKLKRSLSFNDGLNINKTLQTKRKNRIKKVFGKRAKVKKMKMANFMTYLKSLEESSVEETENPSINGGTLETIPATLLLDSKMEDESSINDD